MRAKSALPLALLITAAAVVTLYVTGGGTEGGSREAAGREPDAADTAPPRAAVPGPSGGTQPIAAAAERVAAGAGPDAAETTEPETTADVEPGYLLLRVVDPGRQGDLTDLVVRGHSEDRWIERRSDSPIELRLTPGAWTLAIRHRGYDDLTIPDVAIVSGERNDLGLRQLSSGRSSIVGKLRIAGGSAGEYRVRLRADRQFPCATHPGGANAGCHDCRRGAYATERSGHAGDAFAFDGLTAGSYWMSALSPEGGLLLTREVTVPLGATVESDVVLDLRSVTVRLRGPDGSTFTGAWLEDGVEYGAPVRFTFYDDDRCCRAAHSYAASDGARLRREPELPADFDDFAIYEKEPPERTIRIGAWESTVVMIHESSETSTDLPTATYGSRGWLPAEDTRRGAGHVLLPPRRAPTSRGRTRSSPATVAVDGVYEIQGVPAGADRLLVVSGPWFAAVELRLDPTRVAQHVDCRLETRCSTPSDYFMDGPTCTSCHAGLPETDLLR